MPQQRTTLLRDAVVHVERVVAQAADHWSPTYCAPGLRYVLPGTGVVQLKRGQQEVLVDPLTAFALATGEPYQLRSGHERLRSSVVVSAEQAALSVLPLPSTWLLAPCTLYALRSQWRGLQQGRPAPETVSWLAGVLRASPAAPVTQSAPVRRAREVLLREPGTRRSLAEIAEDAHSTPFHLAHLFRRQTGLSLHQYRHRLRLAASLVRLEQGERDLAGLAHDLGYASQSHFGAVFRAAIGTTPAVARMRLAA